MRQHQKSWIYYRFDEDIYNEIVLFLTKHCFPRQWANSKLFKAGGFNGCFLTTFTDINTSGAILF